MNQKSKSNMYKLLRELSDVKGIARMTILCLEAFIESIHQLKCTREEFDSLYRELGQAIRKSQPNIIPLIHLMEYFELDMQRYLKSEMDIETVRKITIRSLEEKILLFKRNAAQVTQNGLAYIQDRDVIIVHSASTVVTNILIQAKERLNRRFKVVILDLNPERTRQTFLALQQAGIDYLIIPAHNLSHHIESATKMFVGAMTITEDKKIIAPVGTAGTVSLCRLNGIKVHLFANTLHYSHRDSMAQNIFQVKEPARAGITDFSLITHSHDLLSLSYIDHIVSEIGEVSHDGSLLSPPTPISRLRSSAADNHSLSETEALHPKLAPA